jgi:HEAT repeat protein
MTARDRRRAVIVAGHRGDVALAIEHLHDADGSVRASALNALDRIGALTGDHIIEALGDHEPGVRRRATELAGGRPGIDLTMLLADVDATVVESAAWACGEQEDVSDEALTALIGLVTDAGDPLVREAAAAALGAIGDERGLPAVLAACSDKPHVRRRAVLALAPFEGDEVEAAIDRALEDRDWQVRQAAEDLRRAAGEVDLA